MTILVTGAARYIGMHITKRLLQNDFEAVEIDNMNDYYDQNFKKDRLKELIKYRSFTFLEADIADCESIVDSLKNNFFQAFIHLPLQAGARYSINPKLGETYCCG